MEDDGQEIGPVYLPGMLAPEAPKTTKSAEDTRREWELVKAGVSLADANKPLERDSWMTELPTSSKASINLGKMQRSVTRFSRHEHGESDTTWTATPGEEIKEAPKASLSLAKQMAKEAAQNYKKEKYGNLPEPAGRNLSLLEIHLQKIEKEKEEQEKKRKEKKDQDRKDKESRKRKRSKDKKEKKHKKHKKDKDDKHKKKKSRTEKDKSEPVKPEAYWDRDRDLIISHNDPKRRASLLQSASGLSSRFETKGFL